MVIISCVQKQRTIRQILTMEQNYFITRWINNV